MFDFPAKNEVEATQSEGLRLHMELYSDMMVNCKLCPDSRREKVDGIIRSISGNLNPFDNMIFGWDAQTNWNERIVEQLDFYGKRQLPFTWPVDQGSHPELREALVQNGFKIDWSLYPK